MRDDTAARMMKDAKFYYVKGICELLKEIRNGRANHKRDNMLQAFNHYLFLKERGIPVGCDKNIDELIIVAKKFIKEEQSLISKQESENQQ